MQLRILQVGDPRLRQKSVPIAAATPIAGAPRMTMVVIARATAAPVRHSTYFSTLGNFR